MHCHIGLGRSAVLESFTNAYVIERASVSTLPFAIDDASKKPSKGSDLNELVVDIYNQGRTGTLRKGSVLPVSCPLITTNYKLSQDERFARKEFHATIPLLSATIILIHPHL